MEKVRDLFKAFEEKIELIEWLTQENIQRNHVKVHIGKENKPRAFQECAVVSAGYVSDEERDGVVAVIGPRRMRYSRTISVVKRTRDLMEEFLRQGDGGL